jgi:hypothetical protein
MKTQALRQTVATGPTTTVQCCALTQEALPPASARRRRLACGWLGVSEEPNGGGLSGTCTDLLRAATARPASCAAAIGAIHALRASNCSSSFAARKARRIVCQVWLSGLNGRPILLHSFLCKNKAKQEEGRAQHRPTVTTAQGLACLSPLRPIEFFPAGANCRRAAASRSLASLFCRLHPANAAHATHTARLMPTNTMTYQNHVGKRNGGVYVGIDSSSAIRSVTECPTGSVIDTTTESSNDTFPAMTDEVVSCRKGALLTEREREQNRDSRGHWRQHTRLTCRRTQNMYCGDV